MLTRLWIFIVFTAGVLAAVPGGFEDGGNTMVSAMMMFLGNEHSVYILDKAEGNAARINGHPAWGSLWDIQTRTTSLMDIKTNSFCASGMHLPNGSFVTFGGNSAVTTGGVQGSQTDPDGSGIWDSLYQNFDGRRAIRIVNPCKISDSLNTGNCKWFDEPELLSMKKRRWYSTVEPTGEGRIVIMGGMVNGGFINRFLPNVDPATEAGQAESTYEYFPAKDGEPQVLNFIVKTSGLNTYPHAFLMPSGKIFLQANVSTTLWDDVTNQETPLPDMPNGIIRVYPASGAVTMLPLTPANNWTPTILFCGGNGNLSDADWGTYAGPGINPTGTRASADCQRITPEPLGGSSPVYVKDDDMLEPRTMSQFIILPTGQLLLINGGQNGTAGYSTPSAIGYSLASEPVLTPVIYDPKAPAGSRWSRQGLSPSQIPRLYHSTALLLPDGSVMVAGSNPNPDVLLNTTYSTEYRVDIFYPPYFSASVRPNPRNLPGTLSYGGTGFDIFIPSDSYSGGNASAEAAADATIVTLVRGGFTTHAMNMGQRFLQLNHTYTLNVNGSITLHVAQLPPNPNLFQPGPALLYVCINGIPSTGKYVIVGNGNIGPQPTAAASPLPPNSRETASPSSTATSSSTDTPRGTTESKSHVIGGVVGTVAIVGLVIIVGLILFKQRSKDRAASKLQHKPLNDSEEGVVEKASEEEEKGQRPFSSETTEPFFSTDFKPPFINDDTASTDRTSSVGGSTSNFDPYAAILRTSSAGDAAGIRPLSAADSTAMSTVYASDFGSAPDMTTPDITTPSPLETSRPESSAQLPTGASSEQQLMP